MKLKCSGCGVFISNPKSKESGKCRQCSNDVSIKNETGFKRLFKK